MYEIKALADKKERALLVGLKPTRRFGSHHTAASAGETLEELARLTHTAGATVVNTIQQRPDSINAGTFVSRGKMNELKRYCSNGSVDLIIFDDDLSPGQAKNLSSTLETKVIDRSELILSIFAARARSREARLQVELAQLEYLLPRLTRMWGHLSRQQGGIGTRGPGETQLEVDRRRVRERIAMLRRKLKGVAKEREVQRVRRRHMHRTALVGYTNAGKSTVMNVLTGAQVLTEDKLFATLDATTRRFRFPDGKTTLISDTVGFIRKLPHHLVASFRSTLEEVVEADLLLHVVDASSPMVEEQINAVNQVLDEIGARVARTLLVLNKADVAEDIALTGLRAKHPQAVVISAQEKTGLPELRDAIHRALISN